MPMMAAARFSKKARFQRGIIKIVGQRPGQPGKGKTAQIVTDRRAADTKRLADLAVALAKSIFETYSFADLTHRQSLSGHGAPRIVGHGARPYRRLQIASDRTPKTFP